MPLHTTLWEKGVLGMNGGLCTTICMIMLQIYLQSLYLQGRSKQSSFGCYYITFEVERERIMKKIGSNPRLGIPIFGLGPPLEVEFQFRFWFQRFWSDFFSNPAVEKLRNRNSDSEIWNSEKNKQRNSIHLISHMMSIVIGQPVGLTMSNHMDVGTIPGKGNLGA